MLRSEKGFDGAHRSYYEIRKRKMWRSEELQKYCDSDQDDSQSYLKSFLMKESKKSGIIGF